MELERQRREIEGMRSEEKLVVRKEGRKEGRRCEEERCIDKEEGRNFKTV